MFLALLQKIFPTKQLRDVRRFRPLINRVNQLESWAQSFSESSCKQQILAYKEQLVQKKITLPQLLPNVFALVREASMRTLGMRHFDVQIMGGAVLFSGNVAEMKTGEGKTLTATLSTCLHALQGEGVHVVTVNDYLSQRDCQWMYPIYEYLGISVDCIDRYSAHTLERRQSYLAEVTFGTNSEFGFDFLRDNMCLDLRETSCNGRYNYCVIDEVDSILIDEARTPLVISGAASEGILRYYEINKIVPHLKEAKRDQEGKEVPGTGDFVIDQKDRYIYITDDGAKKIEKLLDISNLYNAKHTSTLHHINQAIRAHKLLQKDVDYIVRDGKVLIVDEFTGRVLEGRRFSEGLHQAIEAKEKLQVEQETQTIASITYQNFFRLYKTVSGMTGTAETEALELKKIYSLDVVEVPSNVPMIRKDCQDCIYRTKAEKDRAIVEKIIHAHAKKQPILLGTLSVERSEELSKILTKKNLQHEVLNAKNHAREAAIIEKAGLPGSITIATNMAGRGTDIKLGVGVQDLGGLLVIGSERAESRRVDNQLRGRSGRQGDPGESQFFLSLEDDLMKRFGSERLSSMMLRLGMQEGEEIQHPWVTKAIVSAQKRVEARNFDIRKHLLQYDNVMNQQRKSVYAQRAKILAALDLFPILKEFICRACKEQILSFADQKNINSAEIIGFVNQWFMAITSEQVVLYEDVVQTARMYQQDLIQDVQQKILHLYLTRREGFVLSEIYPLEKTMLLSLIDTFWKEHLYEMDQLREGVALRSYAERKPLEEFKREGFALFSQMSARVCVEITHTLMKFNPRKAITDETESSVPDALLGLQSSSFKKKVGRNEPCICGSTKKFKHCCGK